MEQKDTSWEECKDMIDDFNIIDFYRMSKWWMKIILTIILPFMIIMWITWVCMSLMGYIFELGMK